VIGYTIVGVAVGGEGGDLNWHATGSETGKSEKGK
jgi:hypothetical protein